ncbi:MAG: hypothetical protein GY926_12295 [bacterium]|nr:hypothetical protein [bacterium]MCP4966002.1 hypothetical protein [bacterium]
MKVLVAAGPGSTQRPDDFNWTVDGELVSLPIDTCDCPDCGCERAVAGLASCKATTTFTVVDNPILDADDYVAAFSDALKRQGWVQRGDEAVAAQWARKHLRHAARFSPGQTLEVRNGEVRAR